jgi:hypothetical protein
MGSVVGTITLPLGGFDGWVGFIVPKRYERQQGETVNWQRLDPHCAVASVIFTAVTFRGSHFFARTRFDSGNRITEHSYYYEPQMQPLECRS